MKIAALIDDPKKLKAYKDTSVYLLKGAEQLGFKCFYFTLETLFTDKTGVYAHLYSISIGDVSQEMWFEQKSLGFQNLNKFDCILMRKDPPFDMQYIYATYCLDLLVDSGVKVINAPSALRSFNEKFSILQFPNCITDSLVSNNQDELFKFWEKHREVIYKPMFAMGGQLVFYVDKQGLNLDVILENLTQNNTHMIMAQRFIPEIKTTGDKRILLVHGKPIDYALARTPKANGLRANLAAGGSGEVVALTNRDREICEMVGAKLLAEGLYFVGLDVIGNYLTEINVTSPTCACEIAQGGNIDIAEAFWKPFSVKNG